MPRSPEQQRIKSLEYYYRVRQKKERRTPGGQGRRNGAIPRDERAGLDFLRKLDRHIELVDRSRITEEYAYVWRLRAMNKLNRARGCRPRSETRAANELKRMERGHCANMREFICKACGNNRLFVPDVSEGKRIRCSVCAKRKRLNYKRKAQAAGTWGVKVRLAKHRRRALRKANGGAGHVSAQDWRDILAKYGSACLCCGSTESPTMDHVVPLSLGGPHDKTNLQPLCALCNAIKRATVADYRFDRPLAPMARDPNVVRYVPGTD